MGYTVVVILAAIVLFMIISAHRRPFHGRAHTRYDGALDVSFRVRQFVVSSPLKCEDRDDAPRTPQWPLTPALRLAALALLFAAAVLVVKLALDRDVADCGGLRVLAAFSW